MDWEKTIKEYPSDIILEQLSKYLPIEWYELAVHLDLVPADYQGNVSSYYSGCVVELLKKWALETSNCLDVLDTTLVEIGRADIASDLAAFVAGTKVEELFKPRKEHFLTHCLLLVVKKVGIDWETLACYLNLEREDIDQTRLAMLNPINASGRALHILSDWKKKKTSPPYAIYAALHKLEKYTILEKLEATNKL